jgi:hypothetical protein
MNDHLVLWPPDPSLGATGAIRFAPKDGGGPIKALSSGTWSETSCLVDSEHFYSYDWSSQEVRGISFADGQTSVLATMPSTGTSRFMPEAVIGNTMYLSAGTCEAMAEIDLRSGQLSQRPGVLSRVGCTSTFLCFGPFVAVEGETVYCAFGARLAAFDGSGARVLTEDATLGDKVGIQQLEALNGRLYYLAEGKLFALDSALGTVARIPAPAPPTRSFGSSQPVPNLKLDRIHGRLYWIGGDALQTYDISEGTFATLSLGELIGAEDQLAVDDRYLYWMSWTGIFRLTLLE